MELRVLLADDSAANRGLMKHLFAEIGSLQVAAEASSEGEAKLWLMDSPRAWDVAVIDLMLEESSGFGVIQRCREVHPHGKIAVFSGYITPVVQQHCFSLGADKVFDKAAPELFILWLCELLRRARQGGAGA